MIARVSRLARRLTETPDYVLGRFLFVRRLYGASQHLLRGRGRATVTVAPLRETVGAEVPVAPSHMVLSTPTPAEHVTRLERAAWSDGIRLTPEAVEKLRDFAARSPIKYRKSRSEIVSGASWAGLDAAERAEVTTATLSEAAQDPTVQALAADTMLLDVATRYLGYAPRLVTPYFFWSSANRIADEERVARNQTVMFHYDVEGYNFVYVAFYLYDTDAANGAHVLVEGSHRSKRIGRLLGSARHPDAEIERDYGKERIVTIEAAAGEGFFEDTSCFHKALPPVERNRLMLQFRYL